LFGGGIYIDEPDLTVRKLMQRFCVKNCFPPHIQLFFVYDTSDPQQLPFLVPHYCIFDHHNNPHKGFVEKAFYSHIRLRSANVLNLYDLSRQVLPDDVLFCFAVALVSETAFLRTACSEDLMYLSRFLSGHVLEDVFELILEGRVKDISDFLTRLSRIEIVDSRERIGIIECKDDDEFLCVVDLAMYPLSLSVLLGKMPWGVWVYCKKKLVQKVYSALRRFENRKAGRIYETKDVQAVLNAILETFEPT
ncbi:MAG: hypothetical protein H5T94_07950, partial [Pseudothermotoga sp.]|nr:hypothetical protein [Pseudothermotoga sp.]